jgi:hypothetical protein
MTGLIVDYGAAIWSVLVDSGVFLLLGFVLAGMLRVFLPEEKIYRYLGHDRFRSVFMASVFGVPLPLCSCSVIPSAIALRKRGASKGATTSFLISTPETGVDSIGITYALLDPLMTVARPLVALLTAIFTGSLVNVLVRRGWDRGGEEPDTDALATEEPASGQVCCATGAEAPAPGILRKLGEGLRYAFGPLLDDLTPWFILGLLLSGAIMLFIPEGFFGETLPTGWASSLLMLVLGTPVYICAAAATPLAAAMIAKGLDPGAALVLLLVGPATNATTLVVVSRFLGRRVLVTYLAGVVGVALVAGAVVNGLYDYWRIDPTTIVRHSLQTESSLLATVVSIGGGVLLGLLLLASALRIGLLGKWARQVRSACLRLGFDPASRVGKCLAIVALLALYGSTSVSSVGPGEMGFVKRFEGVTRSITTPGMVLHLPWPIETLATIRTGEVRSIEVGYDSLAERTKTAVRGRDLAAEAEILTGDENLLGVTFGVHYRVRDGFVCRFRVEDVESLVRSLAEASVRTLVAHQSTFDVLLEGRGGLETAVRERLQGDLDRVGVGIDVVDVRIGDAHAAPEVHLAFRDVASALEDRQRFIRQAEGYHTETLARGRGDAQRLLEEARSANDRSTSQAKGEASRFLAWRKAQESAPDLARLRMYFETVERCLSSVRSIFLLGDDIDVELWTTHGRALPVELPVDDGGENRR